jgi:hypothetical protein
VCQHASPVSPEVEGEAMSESVLTQEILASAKDALARGFKILACEPKDKAPYAKYSPHAVNSATNDAAIALRPWLEGTEANYGIACGMSNLCVIDCDKGLKSSNDLLLWMEKNKLPPTLVVKSGRDSEDIGFHIYYLGAVPGTTLELDGVVGDLKSIGGYVVGPGSLHPSGKKYEIIHDYDLAVLPDSIRDYAKDKSKFKFPKAGSGELIPINTRWMHIRSRAGALRALGIRDEEIMYAALKHWTAEHCEDGANYPDEKIRELAIWSTSPECEESPTPGIVTSGSPDPVYEGDALNEAPLDTILGDAVGDLALGMTDGTFIPPCFARTSIKTLLGSVLDGSIAFPGEETLHMRQWNAIVSARPEAGKSESWKRTQLLLKEKIINAFGVILPVSGFFSSGEHALRTLAENDGKKHLAYFDEMKGLFLKGGGQGSTLFDKLLELYEKTDGGAGSVTHGKASFHDVSLCMLGNFTRNSWEQTVSGKGVAGSGFLSRMTLTYSNGVDYTGDWLPMDGAVINKAVNHIVTRVKWLLETTSKLKDTTLPNSTGLPFIPEEDDDAKVVRKQFQSWLNDQKKALEKESVESGHCMRLEAHFKRDLLLRAAFSPGDLPPRITKEMVERSVLWAKHELLLRTTLWPVDIGTDVSQCERRILNALRKKGPLTKSGVQKFSNADKSSGGYEIWNRAWKALLTADRVILMPQKSDRGKEKFGFPEAMWVKAKGEWVYGV